jgi:hypothetical protein
VVLLASAACRDSAAASGYAGFHVKKQLLALAAKSFANKNLADKSAR